MPPWLAGNDLLEWLGDHVGPDGSTLSGLTNLFLRTRILEADVVKLNVGCCGLAGSSGFEAERYDAFMKVGADRLFPEVRTEPRSTVVTATGASCRQQ